MGRLDRRRKIGVDGDRELNFRLCLARPCRRPGPCGSSAPRRHPLACIEKKRIGEPLAGSQGPSSLEPGQLAIGPGVVGPVL
jgi:hypothetical protein